MSHSFNRREFIVSAATLAATAHPLFGRTLRAEPGAAAAADAPTLPASKAEFPWAATETFINSAAYHPISTRTAQAMQDYIAYRLHGPGPDRGDIGSQRQGSVKEMYGELINAKPSEIAFVESTSAGENIVIAGMDLLRSGGNVVIDELHYNSSLYIYKMLEKDGLEVRIVPHRDWTIQLPDVERAIDRNTKLVSMAWVSNVNGYMHDVKPISDLAHAHGAYVYADVIQGVGAVPLDVKAIGLDMCACSSYKWLMGDRGFGFLYIREDLQGPVVKPTRFGHRQYSRFDRRDTTWTQRTGGSMYETGNIPNVIVAGVSESLRYILDLGVPRIREHAKALTDRLQKELPAMGYASITPPDTPTPIVTFLLPDPADARARLEKANIAVTILADYQQMRVSPSVFNTHEDVDKLLAALDRS